MFWDGFNRVVTDELDSQIYIIAVLVHVSLVIAVAGTGLIIANILRKQDNLVKIVGTSGSIVVIVLAQYILYPSLRTTTLNLQTSISVIVIALSTWAYNHYKQVAPVRQVDKTAKEYKLEEAELLSEEGNFGKGDLSSEEH